MPKLKIDNREVEVPPDSTILDAAELLGIEIPTLCYSKECEPATSCLVCLVKIGQSGRLVPACATAATDGLEVQSETEEVHAVRRSALELLLSDHLGDCVAPCGFGCPAQMNIPQMLRQIASGDLRSAIATVKADIALPAILGRICPAPCEKVCRRAGLDGAVTICRLKQFVADADLASAEPYLPLLAPASGRRVAIIGGGPSGLSAAYYLARRGHGCTIFDENETLGGRLLRETAEDALPRGVLAAEIARITRLGVEVRLKTCVGADVSLAELHSQFDVILIACGATSAEKAQAWGLACGPSGIQVAKRTFETGVVGTFAIGNATRGKGMVIRSAADGREVAVAIDQFLAGRPVTGLEQPFSTRIGRMERDELMLMAASAPPLPPGEGRGEGNPLSTSPPSLPCGVAKSGAAPCEAASGQASRCLHCDCRALTTCKLRKYAAMYHADPRRYKGDRRRFQQDSQHADVIFEPGKCIDCGLCIQITAAAGERLGLTYIGRGFNVRIGVPLGHSLAEALAKVAAQCVAACPTAALAWKNPEVGNRPKKE